MATYWMTFRIAEKTVSGRDDDDRRAALYEAIRQIAGRWWTEPTSFILFSSSLNIDAIAAKIQAAIDTVHNIALLREDGVKSARVLGLVEDEDIFALMEYAQYS